MRKQEIIQAGRLSHKLTGKMLDRQLKIQQVCQVSRESMRWTKKQVESKPAIGQLGSQSDRQGELAVKKPCRQTGE